MSLIKSFFAVIDAPHFRAKANQISIHELLILVLNVRGSDGYFELL